MIAIWRNLYDNNIVVGCSKCLYAFTGYSTAGISKHHTTSERVFFILLNSRTLLQVNEMWCMSVMSNDDVWAELLIALSMNINNYSREGLVTGIHWDILSMYVYNLYYFRIFKDERKIKHRICRAACPVLGRDV